VLAGKRHDGPQQGICLVIILFSKPVKTFQNLRKLRVFGMAKNLQKATPRHARLHLPISGARLFGIFRSHSQNNLPKPRLNHESRDLKIVLLFFADSQGVLHGLHERPWASCRHLLIQATAGRLTMMASKGAASGQPW